MDDAGEKNEGEIEAVRAVEVRNTQRRDPKDFLDELEASLGFVVSEKRNSGEKKGHAGGNRAHPPDEPPAVGGNEKDHQKTGHTTEKDHRENGEMGHLKSQEGEPDSSPLQEIKPKSQQGQDHKDEKNVVPHQA